MTDTAGHTHTTDSASRDAKGRPGYRPVWLTLIVGVSLTLAATAAVYHWEYRTATERTNLEFYSAAVDRLEAMRRDALLDLEVIRAVQSLFRSSPNVQREEFRVFAKPLLDKRPGLNALAWIPKVTRAERAGYEKARRREVPGFRITAVGHDGERTPAPSADDYFPVEFVESDEGETLAPGIDLSADVAVRTALEAARDSGHVVATQPVDLMHAAATPGDLLLFAPLYEHGAGLHTKAARRNHVSGFIVAVFSVSRLVEGALAGLASRGIDLWVFDESSEDKALLHWRPSPEAAPASLDEAREPRAARTHLKEFVSIGGRSWALVAAPAPGQFAPRASKAHWVTLLGGLALTVLLAAYLSTVVRTAAARIRTAYQLRRLNRAHAVLSSCNSALARAQGEGELLRTFCENLVTIGGYRMAWIGFLDPERRRILHPVAQAGGDQGHIERLQLDCGEAGARLHPAVQAVRSARPVLVQDAGAPPGSEPWHPQTQARGYASAIALPLVSGGACIGALAIYATEPYAFDPDEAILLDELAGDLAFGITSFRNTAERDRAQVRLRLRERAIESSLDAIMLTDFRQPHCPIVYVNPAFTRITGYGREEVMGRNAAFLQGDDREQPELEEIRTAIRQMRHGVALLRNYRKDGSLFWNELHIGPVRDESNEVTHFVGIINDVTERVRYQHELEHQANHDSLTGLANRNLLQDRIEQALRQSGRHGDMVGLLMFDLDRFKNVNDSLGHDAGDRLLKAVAERLNEGVRAGDTVARQGGDEFVIVLPEMQSANEITSVVHRALEVISRPIHLHEHEVVITACIGASVYPRDGDDTETLLKNADAAMYRAKAHGPNTFRFYQASMNASALERLTLERHLRGALERGEFELHYQPQAELKHGRIMGIEALVRWRTADGKLVPPTEFIALAEETGLIVPLGEWVLTEACRQAKAWQRRGLSPLRVAVNVSARQFRQPGLFETIVRALKSSGLASHHLELELTESLLMDEPEHAIGTLQRLKEIGVQLALDDFGTGYSSLIYLKRFPFDRVKIDRSFVRNIPEDADDAAIALTVIAMAHSMNLKVTAEGVETEPQRRYLREHGCDEFQGYYLAPPLPARETARLLRKELAPRPAPRRAAG